MIPPRPNPEAAAFLAECLAAGRIERTRKPQWRTIGDWCDEAFHYLGRRKRRWSVSPADILTACAELGIEVFGDRLGLRKIGRGAL